jgi:hypothetical protein
MGGYLKMTETYLSTLPAWVYIALLLFVFVVAVIWLLLPFAVFGTKAVLREILHKQRGILQELKELRLDQQDILYELRRLRNVQLLPDDQLRRDEQQVLREPSNREGTRPDHPRP